MNVGNEDRASWAQVSVYAYGSQTLLSANAEERETIYGDLLTSLVHLADRWGIDFEAKLEDAKGMYRTEVAEDGGKVAFEAKEA